MSRSYRHTPVVPFFDDFHMSPNTDFKKLLHSRIRAAERDKLRQIPLTESVIGLCPYCGDGMMPWLYGDCYDQDFEPCEITYHQCGGEGHQTTEIKDVNNWCIMNSNYRTFLKKKDVANHPKSMRK